MAVDSGRAVWVWSGDEGEKRSVALESPAHSVHSVRGGWPLLVVGADGGLTTLDAELNPTPLVRAAPKGARGVHAAGVVDVPLRAVVVDERGHAYVYSLDTTARKAELLADGPLASAPVLAANVGSDGTLTAIDNANRVHTRTVKDILEAAPPHPGLQLAHPTTPASIVSLPSSSRPLAILSTSHPTPSIALIVPSHDLPAVLASTPVSTATGNKITHVAVIARPSPTHAVIGTVLASTGADESARAVIHVADVTLPAGGVGLALLVGSAARTADVFKTAAVSAPAPSANKMVDAVAAALRSATTPDAAEKVFGSWLDEEDKLAAPAKRAVIPEGVVRRLLDIVFSAALTVDKKTGPYAAKIVHTLVDRRAVSDAMWEGGVVLGALVPCADWVSRTNKRDDTVTDMPQRSVSRLVRTNPSIPSRTSIALIARALASPSAEPTLESTLDDVVSAPTPDPAFRAELRRQITAAGATAVLSQLTLWAEAHAERGDGLECWPVRPAPATSSLPPLKNVLAHATLLLDAHLPSLLGDADVAEPLLERMQAALAGAMGAQAEYRKLKAPVEVALKMKETEKEAVGVRGAKGAAARGGAKRAGGAARIAGAAADEAVVGKWRVEDFVF